MDVRSIFSKATKAVEFMYDKTAEIKRYVDYVKPNGADGQRWEVIHTDVPCRLSSVTLNNTTQGEANVIEYDVKLFLSADIEVLAGDVISVLNPESSRIELFESAKEPFVYVSHQEVLLKRKGYA